MRPLVEQALASLFVLGSLMAGVSIAQDSTPPAARLQQAVAEARGSGRLGGLVGEQYLLRDEAAQRFRLVVSDREILVESETHCFGSRREWVLRDAVSLSATGAVTSMTSAIGSTRVLATVHGDVLPMVSSGKFPAGDPRAGDVAPWGEDRLPPLVSDYLWPLLVDEGTLSCTRVGLSPFGIDPQSGSSRSRFSWEDGTHVVVARGGSEVIATIEWSAGFGSSVLERDAEGKILGRTSEKMVWQAVSRERYLEALEGD